MARGQERAGGVPSRRLWLVWLMCYSFNTQPQEVEGKQVAFTTRGTRLACVLEHHWRLVREVSLKDEAPGSVKQVCFLSAMVI